MRQWLLFWCCWNWRRVLPIWIEIRLDLSARVIRHQVAVLCSGEGCRIEMPNRTVSWCQVFILWGCEDISVESNVLCLLFWFWIGWPVRRSWENQSCCTIDRKRDDCLIFCCRRLALRVSVWNVGIFWLPIFWSGSTRITQFASVGCLRGCCRRGGWWHWWWRGRGASNHKRELWYHYWFRSALISIGIWCINTRFQVTVF